MSTYSVDWVSVKQLYPIGLFPDLGSGRFLKISIDSEGNESKEWESYSPLQHSGSYDTSVRIRAYQGLIEFSGNPSKFGREDNIFGFSDIFQAFDNCINPLMVSLGLPPFTSSSSFSPVLSQTSDDLLISDGAVLTRVDLCSTLSAGSPSSAARALRFLESIVIRGKRSSRYSDGSFSWGSKQSKRFKIYDKYQELISHKKKKSSQYFDDILTYSRDSGLIRFEIELHRVYLQRSGLRFLSGWSLNSDLVNSMIPNFITSCFPSVGIGGISDTCDLLLSSGVKPSVARILQGVAYQWASGVDVFKTYPKPTAYRYRKLLLSTGIDIRLPPANVEQINARVRVIDLCPSVPPLWYRFPCAA